MNPTRLFLRLYVNCESADDASSMDGRLMAQLSRFSPEPHAEPRRYWKMPEMFEFTYRLSPACATTVGEFVARSSGGWSHSTAGNESSSVWNRQSDHVLLVPEVAWAHLELHEVGS